MKTPLNRYEKRQLWQKYQAQKQTKKEIDPDLKRDLKPGWLLSYLVQTENLFWGRWHYWSECQLMPDVAWQRWRREKAMQRGLCQRKCWGFPHSRTPQLIPLSRRGFPPIRGQAP